MILNRRWLFDGRRIRRRAVVGRRFFDRRQVRRTVVGRRIILDRREVRRGSPWQLRPRIEPIAFTNTRANFRRSGDFPFLVTRFDHMALGDVARAYPSLSNRIEIAKRVQQERRLLREEHGSECYMPWRGAHEVCSERPQCLNRQGA